MKVLYITTEGFDTAGPNNQMAAVMISDFLKSGCEVHLTQSHRTGEYPDIPELLLNRNGFTYDIVKRKNIDRSKFVIRYIDQAFYALQSFNRWRRVRDADVVFLQSSQTAIWQVLLLRLFNRRPIVYNIYDVFPGHANSTGVINNKLLYYALRFLQKRVYGLCSLLAVLSEDMQKKLMDLGVPAEKIRIVPAWYDDSKPLTIPQEENSFINEYSVPENKFWVQFAGSIGIVLNRKALIETARLLKDEDGIGLQIIGDGSARKAFEAEVAQEGLDNIYLYPWQPMERIPEVYSACSVCIIPLKKGVIGNGVPSKTAIVMAYGKVIVAAVESDSEYSKLFQQHDVGIAVENEDYRGIANAVLELYRNPEQYKRMSENAVRFSKENYSSSANTAKFINMFNELAGKNGK